MWVKPRHVFDREFEWRHLASFSGRPEPQLGVVSGRRRQGKTFLLQALVGESDGLYFGATEATESESLRLFADALAAWLRSPAPPRFGSWDDAIRYLFSLGEAARGPIVIDEFPYLTRSAPALPSILQREVDRAVSAGTPITVLLCGSAMSVMGGMLAGSAPLRGRAGLELVVRPFPYRLAARFWKLHRQPRLAVQHHAVVGGTPAYLRFARGVSPASAEDFEDWLLATVLDPASPLFREARYLLEEETDLRDVSLYHSVLAAVAAGNNTRGGIAAYVGRKATDIGHHLNVLEDAGLLRRVPDVFRSARSVYRIAEPLITFYQVVMRPRWSLLESGHATAVWRDARARFYAQVVGPHFEQLCREYAISAPYGPARDLAGEVGSGVVADPSRRSQIEVDVAVLAPAAPGEPRRVLALGEAKWGEAVTPRHAGRLLRARDLLAARGYDTRDTRIVCYAGAGADRDLRSATDPIDVVDLPQLYADA